MYNNGSSTSVLNHVFANKLPGVNNTVTTHFKLASLPGCICVGVALQVPGRSPSDSLVSGEITRTSSAGCRVSGSCGEREIRLSASELPVTELYTECTLINEHLNYPPFQDANCRRLDRISINITLTLGQ